MATINTLSIDEVHNVVLQYLGKYHNFDYKQCEIKDIRVMKDEWSTIIGLTIEYTKK